MSQLELCAMTTTYEQIQNIIYDVAHKHQSKWGGDFEEIVASANYHFVRIYKMYDPTKGCFTTWLYKNLAWPLLNEARTELNQKKKREELTKKATVEYNPRPFIDLLDGLSSDAKDIVGLILNTPPELEELMETENGRMKSILRKYLRKSGVNHARISYCFQEIQTSLG